MRRDTLTERQPEPVPGSLDDMNPATQIHWWLDESWGFKDDPVFDEISRLGDDYRRSLRPDNESKS